LAVAGGVADKASLSGCERTVIYLLLTRVAWRKN